MRVHVCVCVCYPHRVSSPTVSEEALGLGGRVAVGMMVLEVTTSVICTHVHKEVLRMQGNELLN